MTDETISYFQRWHLLYKKRDRSFAHYYHYVVGTAPLQNNISAQPSDRLMVAAFEDTCSPSSPLWKRADIKDALCIQCERARPLYEAARTREQRLQQAQKQSE